MAWASKILNHPTFGQCELVPSIIAIRWVKPVSLKDLPSVLAKLSLSKASEVPSAAKRHAGALRDPRPVNVNQSETLAWASGKLSDADVNRVKANSNVAWISPVYRAKQAEKGPQSYFAVNPTVLLISESAAGTVGGPQSIDDAASVDMNRSKLLRGFLVINLPNANAITVASRISETAAGTGGLKFENIPYLSPVCCGCAGTSALTTNNRPGNCSPSTVALTPNDTLFANQWGLQRINAPRAWSISEGDANIVVAVLDQGVDLTHPDLNLWPVSYSTITHTNDGSPVGHHGTACAGIIGGRIDNALGVAGLAGRCRVMAVATNFADTEVAEGLYYAADNGARVVSMSFGVYPSWMTWDFAIIEAALQYAQDKNVVLAAASGNENQNVSRFPGSDPRTICVGGSNRDDVRKSIGDSSIENWWGACFGPSVDVVAPCLEIPTTDRQGAAGYTPTDYDLRFNGTSSATPHVAALAGLVISVNPSLTNAEVRAIISESTDKINTPAYVYSPTAGKPFGTWNNDVGYGRINAERALLIACKSGEKCKDSGPCCVELPVPDPCCVSPCDPPWRPDEQCLVWYETKFFRIPIGRKPDLAAASQEFIEFRITYAHRLCLLGKQHGPLLYTVTLLPGEKVTLYHSDRYRQITSTQERFSVQTTFSQFLSIIHQARVTSTLDALSDRLASVKTSVSGSFGGGLAGLLGLPSGSASTQASVTDHNSVQIGFVSDQFSQSIAQASQLTTAERSLVVSTYEDKESIDVTSRILQNNNECRTVTYFVRKVVELYAFSTAVSDISYRIVAPNLPSDWHSLNDLAWLPQQIQAEIKNALKLLPKVGDTVQKPQPISVPTDGAVYDPELAHCCSCEPEKEAAMAIRLEREKAAALKACLETQVLEIELQRRRLLLQKGDLAPFESRDKVASEQDAG